MGKKETNNWSNTFYYDEGNLYWKKVTKFSNVLIGDKAGTIANTGYVRVGVNKKYYSAHRIIWEMFYGEVPDGLEIDHIDQNKENNNLSNLRLVSKSVNQLNKKNPVFTKRKNGKFRVRISKEKKRVSLGDYATYEEALLIYNKHKNDILKKAIYG